MTKRTKTSPTVAVAYVRCSTTEQQLSPDAQRAAITDWAQRNGVTVAAWHADEGVSGSVDVEQRPGLMAALAALKVHRAGLLVVLRRDRIARDASVAALVDRAVDACGARTVNADGIANGADPATALLRTVLDGVSQFERSMIKARTKAALATKRARGERTGNVPFGYRATDDGKLVEHEGEKQIIAEIRRLRATGLTFHAIRLELERAGFHNRAGRAFGLEQLHKLAKAA